MTASRLQNVVVLGLFAVAGALLMYVGYFNDYSPDLFVAYLLGILLYGGSYIAYFGLMARPEYSIYTWLFMFLVFPKKPLNSQFEALLNIGLGFRNSEISMYQVLDIFFSLADLVALLARRTSVASPEVPRNVRLVYLLGKVTALWALVHIGLVLIRRDIDLEYHSMVVPYWQLVEGLILFRAAVCFLKRREHVETLFWITMVASLLLVGEFALVKVGILPESVEYYSLNYRGAFRSVVQSGDLFVTQILILGACSAVYFYCLKLARRYLLLVAAFGYVVLETYNRGSLFAFILAVVVIFFAESAVSRAKLYAFLAAGAAFGAVYWSAYGSEVIETIGALLDTGGVKAAGYFSAASMVDRLGAMWRAMDAFFYSPWFGVGPGNIRSALGSANLPGATSGFVQGKMADFYEAMRTGEHKTNAHNLFINQLAEYGIVMIPFAFLATRAVLVNYFSLTRARAVLKADSATLYLAKLACYAALFGFALYYLFQAEPLLVGVFFLWIRITALGLDGWETAPPQTAMAKVEIARAPVRVSPAIALHS